MFNNSPCKKNTCLKKSRTETACVSFNLFFLQTCWMLVFQSSSTHQFWDPLPSGITMVSQIRLTTFIVTVFFWLLSPGGRKYLSNGFRWATNDTLGYVHIDIYLCLSMFFLDKMHINIYIVFCRCFLSIQHYAEIWIDNTKRCIHTYIYISLYMHISHMFLSQPCNSMRNRSIQK